jgi:hypothetical protein
MERLTLSEKIPMEERNWITPTEASKLWDVSVNVIYGILNTENFGGLSARRLKGKDKSHTSWAIAKVQPGSISLIFSKYYHSLQSTKLKYTEDPRNLRF